jgi:hypothetical protein
METEDWAPGRATIERLLAVFSGYIPENGFILDRNLHRHIAWLYENDPVFARWHEIIVNTHEKDASREKTAVDYWRSQAERPWWRLW